MSSRYVRYLVTIAAPCFSVSSNEKLAPGSRNLGDNEGVVRTELEGSYGVVQTEAPRLAPVSLTVLVQR